MKPAMITLIGTLLMATTLTVNPATSRPIYPGTPVSGHISPRHNLGPGHNFGAGKPLVGPRTGSFRPRGSANHGQVHAVKYYGYQRTYEGHISPPARHPIGTPTQRSTGICTSMDPRSCQ